LKFPPLFTTTYAVRAGEVLLSVIVGEAQLGGSAVKLGGKEIGRGEIKDLKLGNGSRLAGKKVSVKTVVTDTNDKTNHTSVRYTLTGGAVDARHDLSIDVDQEGESVIYRIEVEFVE
jgi:hypothetical protein